ncbi:MAG: hypothetical protein QM775_29210 [Pirellulales bacterium]
MTTRLSWIASPAIACRHAAEWLAAGGVPAAATTAELLTAKFAEPAAALAAFLDDRQIPRREFFDHLTPAGCDDVGMRHAAHTALTKSVGRARAEPLVETLVGLLADCEQAYFAAFPNLRSELELRYGPLRKLWETARAGPDRSRRARRPIAGSYPKRRAWRRCCRLARGGGWSAAASNTVVFEMVLADPIAGLPETVRLGWLVSQLNFDLPDFSELLAPGTARVVAACAMLPVVLEAAADLEMLRLDEDGHLLATAAEAWLPSALKSADVILSPARLAALRGWRETSRRNDAPWGVKLKALERLLSEAE